MNNTHYTEEKKCIVPVKLLKVNITTIKETVNVGKV